MYEKLLSALTAEKIAYLTQEPMNRHTTFKIGGAADVVVLPEKPEALAKVVRLCRAERLPYLTVGRGSNLLVSDDGIEGVVVKTAGVHDVRIEGETLVAGCGAPLSAAANAAKAAGLSGLECVSGIPGSVGGAVYMNAGAYGGNVSNVLASCRYVSEEGELCRKAIEDMAMEYRHTCFTGTSAVVAEASFQLTQDSTDNIAHRMEDYQARRREKQPLTYPSGGSFFKRPTGHFAGALIEECGLKGKTVGGAQISELHAGFIINIGGATCADVCELMRQVQEIVLKQTGVSLEPEVEIVGRNLPR